MLVPLALATWAVTARSVPGHQARYQPFLTVAWTELPSLRVMVTPVTPAPIGPSTIVSACPSESDSPAPLQLDRSGRDAGCPAARAARADRDAVALHAGGAVGIDRGGVRAAGVGQNRRAGTRAAVLFSSGELARQRCRRARGPSGECGRGARSEQDGRARGSGGAAQPQSPQRGPRREPARAGVVVDRPQPGTRLRGDERGPVGEGFAQIVFE